MSAPKQKTVTPAAAPAAPAVTPGTTPLSITINGMRCAAGQGETVLDVARREGVDIPALCHQAGSAAWGGCRLCLVEVAGVDKLQAACTTWVADDMSVQTETPRVRARRESYLRMYLSDHNSYCEAPCTHACPTHVDIPGYLAALAAGDAAGAAALVREELPFPGILGRVCPRYCEPVCRRGDVDEPLAICALHRAAADHSKARLARGALSGKRVAVVGAGPAGLSAAWFLIGRGHQVTLYDAQAQAGGSLRYVIPEFRLPAKVLDDELQPLWDAGARFVGDSKMHYETDPRGLFDAGFDAVVLSTGAKAKGSKKGAPNERRLDAFEFLRQQRNGHRARLSGRVVVFGDGTTAVDAARTALRSGAETVTVVSRYNSDTMPAGARDIAAAREEGVSFEFEAPAGRLEAETSSTVILAAENEGGAPLKIGGDHLHPNPYTGRTSQEGLFVAGDALGGPRSVIHAVAGGKRAAVAIDAWLRGEDLAALEEELAAYSRLPYLEQLKQAQSLDGVAGRLAERDPVWLKMGASAEPEARAAMPKAAKSKRLASLDVEVEKGYTLAAAQAEAKRCLQCECPSLGDCDLQRLGVEYGITTNDLVKRGSRIRVVEPQLEHPFIRRDMERCIACGRCVRVCRDVAGPACYDFTGRGFTINVDTPYGDALQLADCISCGRCVSICPTGALLFNERELSSFRVDESRCILCRECVNVCPVDALEETDHFESARQDWLQLVGQGSQLAGGHRMCAGCGAPVVVRQVLMGTSDPVVVSAATGCLEVSTTIYPYTSWKGSFIHTAFENSAATLSGVETAFRALKKKGAIDDNIKFIAFGGDGGTYDIGLQSLSGAMERGHKMLYVCYDNGAYMNTGFQRSGATPTGAWTTTSPVGPESAGKLQQRKNLTELMIAHGIPYIAQASPHDPRDLVRKAAKALATDGPTFLNVLAPCPRGWRSDGAESIDLAREAVNTCYWPLFEYEDGEYRLTYRPHHKLPLVPWLKRQGRFAHLFQASNAATLEQLERYVDDEWNKLLRKCGEPSEADWQAHLQASGCLLR
jgi:pyruvate/2-oxoacid:ferredoxin oxidoreductase beta subunit/NADPH-dependent glutamate synthase beta subunit-like oxidoreductase/ferredoxin